VRVAYSDVKQVVMVDMLAQLEWQSGETKSSSGIISRGDISLTERSHELQLFLLLPLVLAFLSVALCVRVTDPNMSVFDEPAQLLQRRVGV
jgi:hypothetical protein